MRRVPPHFSILPENVEVLPGGSVSLSCVAVGSPMPYVKWRLGALELTPDYDVPIGRNVLTLRDIKETAIYTCVAASDLGNIEAEAEVRVKGKDQLYDITFYYIVLLYLELLFSMSLQNCCYVNCVWF